jgi:predicted porin
LYPSKDNAPFGRNNIAVGLGFHKELGDLDVKWSLTGIFDKSYLPNTNDTTKTYYLTSVHDTAAYHVGIVLGYQKIQFGGGFVYNGRSRVPTNSDTKAGGLSLGNSWQGDAGKSWNLGVGYDFGNSRVAVAYQQTFRKTDAISSARSNIGSATYNITPWQGMSFYAEVDYVNTTTNAASVALAQSFNDKLSKDHAKVISNNRAMIGLVGVKLSF